MKCCLSHGAMGGELVYLVKRRKVDGREIGAGVLRQAHENERAGDGHDHELLVHPLYVSHVLRWWHRHRHV